MALVPRRNPDARELRWFGLLLAVFLALIGLLVLWRVGSVRISAALGAAAVVLGGAYYLVPTLQRPMYDAWTLLFYPVGWTVSCVILAAVFYLVITPLGFLMRRVGYDPMDRKFEPQTKSYWRPHRTGAGPDRYFRQF